jgi:predicted nucleic acid-binding protein
LSFLLDTNVLSEVRKPRPDDRVMAFLESVEPDDLFVSALTVGELHRGVERLRPTDPQGAAAIAAWLTGMERSFADRILPVDVAVAARWGLLSADRSRPVVHTLIAATALAHDLTVVTRNVHDMRGIDVRTVDPWSVAAA